MEKMMMQVVNVNGHLIFEFFCEDISRISLGDSSYIIHLHDGSEYQCMIDQTREFAFRKSLQRNV